MPGEKKFGKNCPQKMSANMVHFFIETLDEAPGVPAVYGKQGNFLPEPAI